MWLTDGNDADASSEGEVEPKLRQRYSNNPLPTIRLNNNEHAVSVPEYYIDIHYLISNRILLIALGIIWLSRKSAPISAEPIAGPSFRSTMELGCKTTNKK